MRKTLLPSTVTVEYEKTASYKTNGNFANSLTEKGTGIYHNINIVFTIKWTTNQPYSI